MDEKSGETKQSRITRRRFVGTLGAAAAAAGAFQLGRSQAATASQLYYYQDSFGNIIPVDQALIDLGIYPPPVPAGLAPTNAANPGEVPDAGTTGYSAGYPQYNILLIVVDQMRNPAFWLPSPSSSPYWWNAYNSVMPNITKLAKQWSFVFSNYFVAATVCTPSRACLLTGLYSQQTCIFQTSSGGNPSTPPPLLPYNTNWSPGGAAGFPSIGNVLSQPLNRNNGYDCAWIGKWHLSLYTLGDDAPGKNGPSDYGFANPFNIPTLSKSVYAPTAGKNGYPSPNGVVNGGAGGDFLDSPGLSYPAHDIPNFLYATDPLQYNNSAVMPYQDFTQLNDAAIADAFATYWLPDAISRHNHSNNGTLYTPWFCAVSFVNPHDITDFPWAFGLVSSNNSQFTFPVGALLSKTANSLD